MLVSLPQHPDEYRPQRPILLAVDQELGELATFWVAPELSDPLGALDGVVIQAVSKMATWLDLPIDQTKPSKLLGERGSTGSPTATFRRPH